MINLILEDTEADILTNLYELGLNILMQDKEMVDACVTTSVGLLKTEPEAFADVLSKMTNLTRTLRERKTNEISTSL